MVIILAFQAKDGGPIPLTRSKKKILDARFYTTYTKCHSTPLSPPLENVYFLYGVIPHLMQDPSPPVIPHLMRDPFGLDFRFRGNDGRGAGMTEGVRE